MEIQGEEALYRIFEITGFDPGFSKIVETDFMATSFNMERLAGKRIVILSCGHRAVATFRQGKKMTCPRCVQLMKQGLDYDLWINHRQTAFDGMVWREDPVRKLNEPTDLAGNFIQDPLGHQSTIDMCR